MLSTVDLELTNFINSDLTWKVKKGCRSTKRRSRKLVTGSLNFGVELGNKSRKRDEDSSVFESEELGVAVLGQRFAEKVVDIPIKKRRILIQSSSPPPRTCSPCHEQSLSPKPRTPTHLEESELLLDSKRAAAGQMFSQDLHSNNKKWAFDGSFGLKYGDGCNGVPNGKMSEVTNEEHEYNDDFLGIELLADAACSSSIDDGAVNNVKKTSVVEDFAKAKGLDSPNAARPFIESIASSGTGNFSQMDLANIDDMGDSFVEDSTFAVSADLNKDENSGIVKSPAPSKDERLHWDLNTVMEAWEEPYDGPLADSQISKSELVLKIGRQCEKFTMESCEMLSTLKDAQCDIESEVQSVVCKKSLSDVEGNEILLDSKRLVIATAKSSIQEEKLKECSSSDLNSIEKQYVTAPTQHAPEPLNCAVSDTIASIPVKNMDASLHYCGPESHHTTITHDSDAIVIKQMGEDSCGTSVAQNRKSSSGSFQAGNSDLCSADMPHLHKSVCEDDGANCKICEDFGKPSGLPDSRTSPKRVLNTPACKKLDVKNSIAESDKADNFHSSPNGEALSSSSTSVVIGEVKPRDDKAPATDATVNDFALQIGSMELMASSCGHLVSNERSQQGAVISQVSCKSYSDADIPTNCTGNHAPENNFSDCYGSDVTQDGHMADAEHVAELDAGYDSSFEDGELREPGVYTLVENEVEEGETECVDYGSDYGDGDDFDDVDYSMSENVQVGQDGYEIPRKGNSLAKDDDIKKNGILNNSSDIEGGSDKAIEQGELFNEHWNYGFAERNSDGHTNEGFLAGEFRSWASRGKLSSYYKGPSSFDVLERRNTLPLQRSRYGNPKYSYPRAERDFSFEKSMERDRFSFKACRRNEADGRWVDSSAGYRDARNRYPHSYRGPERHGYSRPRDAIANSGAKFGGFNSNDDRQSINYSSNGMYRSFMRRKSPVGRDGSYSGQRGIPSVRGIACDRSRSRSGLYAQEIRRDPKEVYAENVPDAAVVSSARRQQYFARRERDFSPDYSHNGPFLRPHRNSRSRSRTRSPVAWHLQRDRNVSMRRRSPDFRSGARMERMRSPFQKPNFAADSEENFMSPRRRRMSPQNNSRWFDNGNYMDNHFRDRRSSVRMFRRSERFDSVGYSGRLKSDGFFQPMISNGRFPSSSGRGRDFEESDDERMKQDEKYEMNYRVRRYNTAGGAVGRFHYNDKDRYDDGCVSRGTIKRDIPRSGAREERVPRYNNAQMHASATVSGLRDNDDGAATREE